MESVTRRRALTAEILAAVLACTLIWAVALLPGSAYAESSFNGVDDLFVAGKNLSSATETTSPAPGVTYDPVTNLLTLDNVNLTCDSGLLYYSGTSVLHVYLVGTNTITASDPGYGPPALQMRQGSMRIIGSGSLEAKGFPGLIWQSEKYEPYGTVSIEGETLENGPTLICDGEGIVTNYTNVSITNAKLMVSANSKSCFFGITCGRSDYFDNWAGKLTINNSIVSLKYSGKGDHTAIAWNELSLSGVNTYVGGSTSKLDGKLNLKSDAYNDVLYNRGYWRDAYVLITPEDLGLASITIGKPVVKVSKKSFVYSGKVQKPTVTVKVGGKKIAASNYTVAWRDYWDKENVNPKNVDQYKAAVNLKGAYRCKNEELGYADFEIVPKAVTIKAPQAKKKAIVVKWAKGTGQLDGYQIQYSLKENFKKAKNVYVSSKKKTSANVKKLKAKKKYFVRVRVWKQGSSGDWCYSAWSKTKSVKTK